MKTETLIVAGALAALGYGYVLWRRAQETTATKPASTTGGIVARVAEGVRMPFERYG